MLRLDTRVGGSDSTPTTAFAGPATLPRSDTGGHDDLGGRGLGERRDDASADT
jgi:hypothetical protein